MVVPLVLGPRRPVSFLELTEWVWDDPPDDASDQLPELLGNVRDLLAELGLRGALTLRDQVCRLVVDPDTVDMHRLSATQQEISRLDDRIAADRLRAALDLCAGEPLAGLPGRRIAGCREGLVEHRRRAELALIRIDLRLGRAADHVVDLVRFFRERPENTEVVTLAMHALTVTGRQAEALAVYRRCCERLVELGMKVPARMEELRMSIVRGDFADQRMGSFGKPRLSW